MDPLLLEVLRFGTAVLAGGLVAGIAQRLAFDHARRLDSQHDERTSAALRRSLLGELEENLALLRRHAQEQWPAHPLRDVWRQCGGLDLSAARGPVAAAYRELELLGMRVDQAWPFSQSSGGGSDGILHHNAQQVDASRAIEVVEQALAALHEADRTLTGRNVARETRGHRRSPSPRGYAPFVHRWLGRWASTRAGLAIVVGLLAAVSWVPAWLSGGDDLWTGLSSNLFASFATVAVTLFIVERVVEQIAWRSPKGVAARAVLGTQIVQVFNDLHSIDAGLFVELGPTDLNPAHEMPGTRIVAGWASVQGQFINVLRRRSIASVCRMVRESNQRLAAIASTLTVGGNAVPEETVRRLLYAMSTLDAADRIAAEAERYYRDLAGAPQKAREAAEAAAGLAVALHNAMSNVALAHAALTR